MAAAAINAKDELILEIKGKISEITGPDTAVPVNLDNFLFHESGRSNCGGKINITCIFINEDGNVCGDMYRSGPAGCVDFICGLDLNSVSEKVLKLIISALKENRWSVLEHPVSEKQKKRNFTSAFKIPFLQKGA